MSTMLNKQVLCFFIFSVVQYLPLPFSKLSVIQVYAYDTEKKHVIEYQFNEISALKPFTSLLFAVCPHFICLTRISHEEYYHSLKEDLHKEKFVRKFAAPTVTNSYRWPGTAGIVKENKRVKKL